MGKVLRGERHELRRGQAGYPASLDSAERPPEVLYVLGDPAALQPGLAVVGARRATPYGIGCARRFAGAAAERGIAIISGGARGCDATAHEAALAAGAPTVAFLGGGIDEPYPRQNLGLFQRIVDGGGALASENPWDYAPLPYTFRERNRLIAGLAQATLIVEAGLPSGTFSTADAALAAGRDVLVVPGAITSPSSRGANRLVYQGATPIVDDEAFADALLSCFGCLRQEGGPSRGACDGAPEGEGAAGALLVALRAEPMGMEALRDVALSHRPGTDALTWLMVWLAEAERDGLIARYPDGRYGPRVPAR